MAKRRGFLGLSLAALAGCTTTQISGNSGRENNESATNTPTDTSETPTEGSETPTEEPETETPPPVAGKSAEDISLENEQDKRVEGVINVETGENERQLEFDLPVGQDTSWEEVPLMEESATITTETGSLRGEYDWPGSQEKSLFIAIRDDEIEYDIFTV